MRNYESEVRSGRIVEIGGGDRLACSIYHQAALCVVQRHHLDHVSPVNGDDHFFFEPGVVVAVIIRCHIAPRYSELARIPACFHSS